MKKLALVTDTLSSKYDCKVSIDTLFLSAKLNDKQREFIYDRFLFNKNRADWHWHYSQNAIKDLGFTIHALPNNPFTYSHYDHVIQLQKGITTADYIPYSLEEIIKEIDWNIKRMDLAFDFKTPQEKSIIMKHHGNVQFDSDDKWKTDYLGKLTSRTPSRVAFYNRNDKELERETGIEHEYFNRYEVRLFPKCNDETMKLHNMKDDFILEHLKKYIVIPNIDNLPLNKWDKRKLSKIKNDYEYMKTLEPAKQKQLKEVTKAHRVPLERIYLDNKDKLFSFLKGSTEDIAMIS